MYEFYKSVVRSQETPAFVASSHETFTSVLRTHVDSHFRCDVLGDYKVHVYAPGDFKNRVEPPDNKNVPGNSPIQYTKKNCRIIFSFIKVTKNMCNLKFYFIYRVPHET